MMSNSEADGFSANEINPADGDDSSLNHFHSCRSSFEGGVSPISCGSKNGEFLGSMGAAMSGHSKVGTISTESGKQKKESSLLAQSKLSPEIPKLTIDNVGLPNTTAGFMQDSSKLGKKVDEDAQMEEEKAAEVEGAAEATLPVK